MGKNDYFLCILVLQLIVQSNTVHRVTVELVKANKLVIYQDLFFKPYCVLYLMYYKYICLLSFYEQSCLNGYLVAWK